MGKLKKYLYIGAFVLMLAAFVSCVVGIVITLQKLKPAAEIEQKGAGRRIIKAEIRDPDMNKETCEFVFKDDKTKKEFVSNPIPIEECKRLIPVKTLDNGKNILSDVYAEGYILRNTEPGPGTLHMGSYPDSGYETLSSTFGWWLAGSFLTFGLLSGSGVKLLDEIQK